MLARLVSVSGPLEGRTFAVGADEFVIGRQPASNLCLADERVSRRHCTIRRESGTFLLRDLGTRNGTRLNGEPVQERHLADGDRIGVGGSTLVFLVEPEPAGAAPDAVLLDERLEPDSTFQIRAEESLYLKPADTIAALPAASVARNLGVLLHISNTINSLEDLAAIQGQLLASVLDAVPADRAVLLLSGRGPDGFQVHARARAGEPSGPAPVSRTVVERVMKERIALLSNDVRTSGGLDVAESLQVRGVIALLCVPMLLLGRTLGVLYLDVIRPSVRFNEEHLQLVTAIAAIGALALANARRLESLAGEAERLRRELDLDREMIGRSAAIQEVHRLIRRVGPTDSTVLIRGESGTGKELVARAIHRASPRSDRPFVTVNCAALPESLVESELFGHEKGAFTGAVGLKRGKLEMADGGTLFLDEIGELPPAAQAKLLRALEEREFERVGSVRPTRVDVRVLAATNRDLAQALAGGGFRPDLYYRLNVVSIPVPPLRERREDIGVLAHHFAVRFSEKLRRPVAAIGPEALACLLAHDWPGNVRELRNVVERAVVLGTTDILRPEDLPEELLEAAPDQVSSPLLTYHAAIRELKRNLALSALEKAGGSFTEAARSLGVHVNYLHRLVRNLGLRAADGLPERPSA